MKLFRDIFFEVEVTGQSLSRWVLSNGVFLLNAVLYVIFYIKWVRQLDFITLNKLKIEIYTHSYGLQTRLERKDFFQGVKDSPRSCTFKHEEELHT